MDDADLVAQASRLVDRLNAEFDGLQFVIVVGDPEAKKFTVASNIPIPNQVGLLAAGIGYQVEAIKRGDP